MYPSSGIPWVNTIVDVLDRNNQSLLDLIRETLRHGGNVVNMLQHRRSMTLNIAAMIDLLKEQAEEDVNEQAMQVARITCQTELQELILKRHELHFGATSATLDQLETFSIEGLASTMKDVCPNIWSLLTLLLDVNPERRRDYNPNFGEDGGDDEGFDVNADSEGRERFQRPLHTPHPTLPLYPTSYSREFNETA